VLKNALDHLAIRQMSYKPVLLVGHGGSRSTQAVDTLRTIVRGFLAIPCPTAVCTAGSDFGGDTIALTDAAIQMRCLRGAKELIQMSRALLPYRSLLREIASQG
jgi:FMN reductase